MFDENFGVNLSEAEKEFLKYYCSLGELYGDINDFPMTPERRAKTYKAFSTIVEKLTTEELQKVNGFLAEMQLKHFESSMMQGKSR